MGLQTVVRELLPLEEPSSSIVSTSVTAAVGMTEAADAADAANAAADYNGTTVESVVGSRNSWEIWKEKESDALVHKVAQFITRNEDSLVQEERW
eukprot:6206857-Prymnesium_polylepis.1